MHMSCRSTRHVHIDMQVYLTWLACKCTSPLAISRARREPFRDHLSRFLRSAAMSSIRSPPCKTEHAREDCCLSTYIQLQGQCHCSSRYYRSSMHYWTCIEVVLTAVMSDASRCRMALKSYGTPTSRKARWLAQRHDRTGHDKLQHNDSKQAFTSRYSNTIMVFSCCRQAP